MTAWTYLMAISCVNLFGCAATRHDTSTHEDKLIRHNDVEVPIEGIHVGSHQRGSNIHFTATSLCDVKREDLVERTTFKGSDASREEISDYQGIIRHAVPCGDLPASGVAIVGILAGSQISLGKTDARGRLTVNLDQSIPIETTIPRSAKLTVQADGKDVGTADLSSLYAQRESKAYEEADREACAAPKSSSSCIRLQSFLGDYPDGPHSAEAAATLRASRPTIEQYSDDDSWARTIAPSCVKGASDDPAEVHAACEPFRYYLARFPSGRHATDARKSLELGAAREQHLISEQRRKQQAESAKEAAEQRKRCVAECRLGCASWRFRDHAACFSGCVEARCDGGNQ